MAVSERDQQPVRWAMCLGCCGAGSQRIFRWGGVATESRVGRRARTVDVAKIEQGAMGIPVGGWDIQRIAQRGGQVVFAGGDRRE